MPHSCVLIPLTSHVFYPFFLLPPPSPPKIPTSAPTDCPLPFHSPTNPLFRPHMVTMAMRASPPNPSRPQFFSKFLFMWVIIIILVNLGTTQNFIRKWKPNIGIFSKMFKQFSLKFIGKTEVVTNTSLCCIYFIQNQNFLSSSTLELNESLSPIGWSRENSRISHRDWSDYLEIIIHAVKCD